MDDLLIILLILLGIMAYVSFITYLDHRKILEKYNMSSWYGIIMWRTKRGRALVDWLSSPKRFWNAYSYLSKAICVIVMISIMALLIWEAFLVPGIPAEQAPTPDMLIGLPGINPIIPLWYGILALIVGVAIHEIGHGIMTRVAGMNIKSMGVLLFIFPIGAFVEPDEDALAKTDKRTRTSVYAAGPATNIIFAIICAFLFSTVMVGSAQVANDGPVLTTVYADTPADLAGLGSGYQIIEMNGVPVSFNDLYNFPAPEPGTPMSITYIYQGEEHTTTIFSGLVILSVSEGQPSAQAGLKSGMILYSLNNITLHNEGDFRSTLGELTPGETVEITTLEYDRESNSYIPSEEVTNITPANRKDYVGGNENMAFLGITSAYLGTGMLDPAAVLDHMAHPFAGASSAGEVFTGSLYYIAMPFTGLQPLDGPYRDIFVPGGFFAEWNSDVFWIVANSFYWIFWINLMLGMTNVLPAVPLDGGFLFRDWIDSILAKVKKDIDEKERERYVSAICYAFIMIVFFLIIWQLIGPRLL